MENITNAKFLVKGKSYYSFLNRKNTTGKYPSNSYEVGIAEPEFKVAKSYDDETTGLIFEKVIDDMIREDAKNEISYIKIKNAKYPIPVYLKDGKTKIENPIISNDCEIIAKCVIKYSTEFDKYYAIVSGVRLVNDYEAHTPFDDFDEFDEF